MNIIEVREDDRDLWNSFVGENFPPVGGFLQSWEWGEFKGVLSHPVKRFYMESGGGWILAFTIEDHSISFGLRYEYAPRGPVFAKHILENPKELVSVIKVFKDYLKKTYPGVTFVRLEPPISEQLSYLLKTDFNFPKYYIQPRFNSVVNLKNSDDEIFKSFSRDMRHDIRAAEKRGVNAVMNSSLDEKEMSLFLGMQRDTSKRAGKEVYPSKKYYETLFDKLPPEEMRGDRLTLTVGAFIASYDGEPVAIHLVVFFADTATYLYGASFSGKPSSKATSYLHWYAMCEAKRLGYFWYDIGGIDQKRWPSLSYFKSQFGGKVVSYLGNIDLVLKPFSYDSYNFMRRIKYPDM